MSVKIVAELGINHNADVGLAKRLITAAAGAGADYVKFQKREPRVSVPRAMWDKPKETPWGTVEPYIEYKERMEFGESEYGEIVQHALNVGIPVFWSVWDDESLRFVLRYDPHFVKIPSALLLNDSLLALAKMVHRPIILSTGMSTIAQVKHAFYRAQPAYLLHSVSSYPCPVDELNLHAMTTLRQTFPETPVGYSGHETGLATTIAAVALGAQMIERHFTLDRTMKGTDQAASVEPHGFARMVKDIRNVEKALGDGEKRVMPSEEEAIVRLRGVR